MPTTPSTKSHRTSCARALIVAVVAGAQLSCRATDSVTPNQPPRASLSQDCTTLTCSFSDESSDSDGSVVSWSWTFGDGSSSSEQNPSHTYAAVGAYTVTLSVQDDQGSTGNAESVITVTNSAPSAAFSTDCTGLTCAFSDESSDSDGSVASWSWTFDASAGSSSSQQNPSHTYASAGAYTVTLSVHDNDGASGDTQGVVTVTDPSPRASFVSDCAGLACSFSDRSSDPNGSIVSWSWTFGDGSGSSQQNPAHRYAAEGTYTVTLSVEDDDGATGDIQSTVSVANASPTAVFSSDCTILTCSFSDESTDPDGSVVSWWWTFGDGSGSSQRNPSHTYASAGAYTVELDVTDDEGASGIGQGVVSVPPPIGDTPDYLGAYDGAVDQEQLDGGGLLDDLSSTLEIGFNSANGTVSIDFRHAGAPADQRLIADCAATQTSIQCDEQADGERWTSDLTFYNGRLSGSLSLLRRSPDGTFVETDAFQGTWYWYTEPTGSLTSAPASIGQYNGAVDQNQFDGSGFLDDLSSTPQVSFNAANGTVSVDFRHAGSADAQELIENCVADAASIQCDEQEGRDRWTADLAFSGGTMSGSLRLVQQRSDGVFVTTDTFEGTWYQYEEPTGSLTDAPAYAGPHDGSVDQNELDTGNFLDDLPSTVAIGFNATNGTVDVDFGHAGSAGDQELIGDCIASATSIQCDEQEGLERWTADLTWSTGTLSGSLSRLRQRSDGSFVTTDEFVGSWSPR